MGQVRVGCAGWSLPRACAGEFPGPGTHLERYGRVLPAVEINTTFYRPHRPRTFERWAACVPVAFRFSLKAPREVTHLRRLQESVRLSGREDVQPPPDERRILPWLARSGIAPRREGDRAHPSRIDEDGRGRAK